ACAAGFVDTAESAAAIAQRSVTARDMRRYNISALRIADCGLRIADCRLGIGDWGLGIRRDRGVVAGFERVLAAIALVVVFGGVAGGAQQASAPRAQDQSVPPLSYTCPMHPEIVE